MRGDWLVWLAWIAQGTVLFSVWLLMILVLRSKLWTRPRPDGRPRP